MSNNRPTLTVYSFEDKHGYTSSYTTFSRLEARHHAQKNKLRVIETVYIRRDTTHVPEWDFTGVGCQCCGERLVEGLCSYCQAAEAQEDCEELVTA